MKLDPNANFYTHSEVYSYQNTGNKEPKIYQAMTSVRQAPGGVVFFAIIFKTVIIGLLFNNKAIHIIIFKKTIVS